MRLRFKVIALLLSLVASVSTLQAETRKVVIGEYFTGTW